MSEMNIIRRRNKRRWLLVVGAFAVVFVFAFLVAKNNNDDTMAANMGAFDPGYIISDWQMSNYTSMNESQIHAFLKSKNSCYDTNLGKYTTGNKVGYFSEMSPPRTWHIKDGHFVCMADEVFDGGTAAHIIWQAAQDYHINPQVLLVLLEKEQSLVTDTFPHSQQYRSATGYGCPDTAPCSSQYYGMKNQIRKAAELFRTVLNGGWTNYPLGWNYVQYNPNTGCGGTMVNIRSLATSALYRYTPYQPNAAALGGWNDGCGAYGNMNFYKLFEDWFGGITNAKIELLEYGDMSVPRILYVKAGARYVDPQSGRLGIRGGASFEYFTSLNHRKQNGDLCLALSSGKNCYLYEDLEELRISDISEVVTPRMLTAKNNTKYIDFKQSVLGDSINTGDEKIFYYKVYINDKLCLLENTNSGCIMYYDLKELPEPVFKKMITPRKFYLKQDSRIINAKTGISVTQKNTEKMYFYMSTSWKGKLCLRSDKMGQDECALYDDLLEINNNELQEMSQPRDMIVVGDSVDIIDVEFGSKVGKINNDGVVYFNKRVDVGGKLCLSNDTIGDNRCVYYSDLMEVPVFEEMINKRYLNIKDNSSYYDAIKNKDVSSVSLGGSLFVDKTTIGGRLCLRTQEDSEKNLDRCIFYSSLSE